MAESILVTGKKISSMELVTNVQGNEKIPTGQPEDLAITPNQIKKFVIEQGDLVNQTELVTEVSQLQTNITNTLNQSKSYTDTEVGVVRNALEVHVNDQTNPHQVTKEQVGLGEVDNTSDVDKPVSNATKILVDNNLNYIKENGAALPFSSDVTYIEGSVVLKDGQLVQKSGSEWVPVKTLYASELTTSNSQTQQEVNDSTGAKWYAKEGGYPLNARVMLDNGDIVRNTVANNTNDPNSNTTGWINQSSASGISTSYGDSVQDELYKQQQGTDFLRDSVTKGTIDRLSNTSSQTPAIDLQGKKVIIPNGVFECADGWLGNKNVGKFIDNYKNFELSGQGDSTRIKYKPTGGGGQLYLDYIKDFKISNLFLDNTPIGSGSPSNVKNGQVWIRYSKDGHLDNLRFAGGDVLSCTIDSGTNILATNMRVDFQYRYQVGVAKSPLIFGGGSKQCMYVQGYVKGVSDDGTVLYNGDLGDNDQSFDSKWAFINMYGIPYATGGNSAACMWQEGEYELSNSHHFGMNYLYNGIGHGISELALGTDIGCTFRENQVRGVWNRQKYVGIGNHFLNITSPNIGSSDPAIGAAIHVERGFTSSVGDFFEGNTTDLSQYNGSPGLSANTSIHCSNNRFSGLIKTSAAGGVAAHLGLSNSAMTNSATFNLESLYTHSVIENMLMTGRVGRFGATGYIAKFRIMASTCLANGTTEAMLTLVAGSIDITDSFIKDYTAGIILAGSNTSVVFRNCKFHNVTFVARDLTDAKYINCEFVNCTNAPNVVGLNFKCDSDLRPAAIRTEVTLAAGGSYTFPSWAHEQRGVYDVNVGGRGENTAVYKGYAHKASAASAATIVNTLESTVGAIVVTWSANGYITITVTTAGTYSIKLG